MGLWIDLHLEFETALDLPNLELVHRILQFAAWCRSDESGPLPNDTSTAAACAFYEHLPDRRQDWRYFRAWFVPHEFEGLVPIFSYHLSENELAQLKDYYYHSA
jgi:hypothetical protein